VPRFGKDKDARNEELDRQAAEEVERLTRRGGPPGMGGGMPGMPGGPSMGMPSPLEMIAAELADAPRPSQRRQQPPRRVGPKPQQAFTPMPSGEVGSSFGPGGLNPGPRMGGGAPPPPAFGGGGGYEETGHVSGPPVYYAGEPDEDEEMSITELALMDHAAHTGHRPEDLVMQYDAGTAEEMRDAAMRQFYERQQARRPGAGTNNPFAPAGMRRGPSSGGPVRKDDPAAAGGALAQRLANRRRREEEEARQAEPAPAPARSSASAPPRAPAAAREAAVDEGALARVLARRRQALGIDEPAAPAPTPGARHATARAEGSPGLRAVPAPSLEDDAEAPTLEQAVAAATPVRRSSKKAAAPAAKASVVKRGGKPAETMAAPAAKRPAKAAPAGKAPAAKAAKGQGTKGPGTKGPANQASAKKAGATLAKAPAAKAPAAKGPAARTTGKAKTVFCIECGEKNPAIAKFCFNCGTRLAAPPG
jgi:hypothetical protein